ncbi:MAG: hypothetical protein J6R59_02930 [Paludibacteraceae bacterium]|jgi:hypothetical protein|nr:hypothetical protein [Paludibacteraceae bacterium]
MGLASSISKITSFATKNKGLISGAINGIQGITKGSMTGTNLPTTAVNAAMGIADSLGFNPLDKISSKIEEIGGDILTGVNAIKCAWDLFSIDDALGFLEQMAMGVVGAVTAVVDQVVGAVVGQVVAAIDQVVGAVLGVIDAIKNMINSILLIVDAILSLWDNWTDWADWKWNLDIQGQSCDDMFSSIAGCLMNQMLGSKFDKILGKITGFGDKVTNKIQNFGDKVNSAIYDELEGINTFSSYANQEAFLLRKASLQIRGLTKENLLGS